MLPSLEGRSEDRCRVWVAFWQLVMLAASVALTIKLQPPEYGEAEAAGEAEEEEEERSESASCAAPLAQRAQCAVEARLRRLCALLTGGEGNPLLRFAAAWNLLSFLWQLAMLAELHYPLPRFG